MIRNIGVAEFSVQQLRGMALIVLPLLHICRNIHPSRRLTTLKFSCSAVVECNFQFFSRNVTCP